MVTSLDLFQAVIAAVANGIISGMIHVSFHQWSKNRDEWFLEWDRIQPLFTKSIEEKTHDYHDANNIITSPNCKKSQLLFLSK